MIQAPGGQPVSRTADIRRDTPRKRRSASRVNLDGSGPGGALATGIGFFDHMLDQIARHGLIDLEIDARATCIDGHHTVEDVGITLGMAVGVPWATRRAFTRYGHAYVPLDEALSRVVVDFPAARGCTWTCPSRPA